MESKRKNIYIIIFVITTILASAIAVYLYLEVKSLKTATLITDDFVSNSETKIKDQKIKDLEKEVADFKKLQQGNTAKIVNSMDFSKIKDLNEKKVDINCFGGSILGFYIKIDSNNIPYLYVSSDAVGSLGFKNEGNKYYKIENIQQDKKVVSACVTGTPQSVYPYIAFLMNDGTVEKLDTDKFKNDGIVCSKGKIEGLTNVVRLENIRLNEGQIDGSFAILAVCSDGTSAII